MPGTPLGVTAAGRVLSGPPPIPTTGLLGWWDATRNADFTYSAGSDPANPLYKYVAQWKDRSGNNKHAVGSGNPGYHPHRDATINGLKAVDFAQAGSYIAVNKGIAVPTWLSAATKPVTYTAVVRFPTPLAPDSACIIGPTNSGLMLRCTATGVLNLVMPGVADIGSSAAGEIVAGGTYLLTATWDTDGAWVIRKNQVQVASGTNGSAPSGTTPLGLASGADYGADSLIGVLAEAITYTRVLTAPEIQQVEQYLYWKWMATSPIPMTGLIRWWDAADETTIDLSGATPAAMMRWRDKALSGHNFYHNPGPLYGSRLLNGKKVLDFVPATNPRTQTNEGPGVTLTQPFTWVIAVQTDVVHTGWDNMLSVGGALMRQAQSQWNIYAGATNVFGGTANTSPHVMVGTFKGATSTIHLDGALLATADPGSGGASSAIVYLGDFDGAIGELIMYNRSLTTSERQTVESYLKAKWGTP
jgi:hypothetical protein